MGFYRAKDYVQVIRFADIAAAKLKQLKDRRLETVQLIDNALRNKFNALQFPGRYREVKECAEERYTLWAMNQMRNPGSINAAFALIEGCIHNEELEDAEHYVRHAMFMINDMADNFIPADERSEFLADGSHLLARAILELSVSGGIPPEGKQKAGDEAIELARQAIKIHTRLHGTESREVAEDMYILTDALDHFNDVDDDEVLHLHEQAISIFSRKQGSMSYNVAHGKGKFGNFYVRRADRAYAVNDFDRCMANCELALPHYREAVRIFRVINRVDRVNNKLGAIAGVEMRLRALGHDRAAGAAAPARPKVECGVAVCLFGCLVSFLILLNFDDL